MSLEARDIPPTPRLPRWRVAHDDCFASQGRFSAAVLSTERVRRGVPSMLAVRYGFRDRRARRREGAHWVGGRSTLGQRLLGDAHRLVVIRDREAPRRNRVARPGDFAAIGKFTDHLPDLTFDRS